MAKAEVAVNAATVYVVDDDDGMRRALSLLLNTVGYKTAAFASPKEFLDKFKPDAAGCLVLDIRMPGMSGLELQQHLNRMGSMLPVIFITGHGDVPDGGPSHERGCVRIRAEALPRSRFARPNQPCLATRSRDTAAPWRAAPMCCSTSNRLLRGRNK